MPGFASRLARPARSRTRSWRPRTIGSSSTRTATRTPGRARTRPVEVAREVLRAANPVTQPSHAMSKPRPPRPAPLLTLLLASLAAGVMAADDRGPVAHWKLAGDAKDASGNRLDATSRGVTFTAKGPDGKSPAAAFDGVGSRLEVKPAPALRLGTGDFTLALWVHTPESLADDLGDLVTLYDAKKRTGFNLSLRNNTGVTSSQPNTRQLQFGIDAGSEPRWADEGRPGNATLAFALAVHDGDLYAGTASNGKAARGREAGHAGA